MLQAHHVAMLGCVVDEKDAPWRLGNVDATATRSTRGKCHSMPEVREEYLQGAGRGAPGGGCGAPCPK